MKTAWLPRWSEIVQRVETRLRDYLVAAHGFPDRLREAISYSLLAPAKRLRPLLCLLACETCGGTIDLAMPVACALEMIHTYSLVHDDLPAMDNDDLRRGRPTCHKQFDEATAILVGDALLTMAFQVAAQDLQPAELVRDVVVDLAQAAGGAGMVGGQWADLHGVIPAHDPLSALESIHRCKTGAMFRSSAYLGGLCAIHDRPDHEKEPILSALTRYAEAFGLGFQIQDDLLDVQGSEELMGKRIHKDAERGKLTYPGLLGQAAAKKRLAEAVKEAKHALSQLGDSAIPLGMLVDWMAERET